MLSDAERPSNEVAHERLAIHHAESQRGAGAHPRTSLAGWRLDIARGVDWNPAGNSGFALYIFGQADLS